MNTHSCDRAVANRHVRFNNSRCNTSAQYQARAQKRAEKILGAVADMAQAAGVACETFQVEHEHPPGDHRYRQVEGL